MAAKLMLAAGGRAVGMVDENVIVAGGAEHAVNGFAELLMASVERVIGFGFRAGHSHERKYTARPRVYWRKFRALLFAVGKTGEGVQRKKFAEDLGGLPRKRMASGDCGGEALADHPAFGAFPFFGVRGPATVLGPFAFFGGIPVARVSAREFVSLARKPREIFHRARHAKAGHGALAAVAVNAQTNGGSIVGNADVELSARAGTRVQMREEEVHVGVVRALVVGEANVAIDAREIFSGATGEAEFWM